MIHKDNDGSLNLSNKPTTSWRSKHILLKYYVIQDYIKNEQVEVIRMPTIDMLADGLTKPFGKNKLENFVSGLGLTYSTMS